MRKSKTALARLLLLAPALLATAGARADPVVDVITGSLQIGEMDLAAGAFTPTGNIPATIQYLAPGPNGSLLTMDFGGNLESIDRTTGATSVIGPTGFSDCSTPASPCGAHAQLSLGAAGGTVYATDFANNFYTVNPTTGKATLVGQTGLPALPATPLSTNPDGSFNFYDENLFGANGKVYVNFDAGSFNPATSVTNTTLPAALYQIDPSTGHATLVSPTEFGLVTVTNVNGALYGFDGVSGEILTLNPTNGQTSFVSNIDPSVGLIEGAAPAAVPEPSCLILGGIGLAAILALRRKTRVH
jgi:outer membrane protein assembly factor BamB